MQKAKGRCPALSPGLPCTAGKLPGARKSHDVRIDEGGRARNGAVDVALGGKMNDGRGPELVDKCVDQVSVTDVGLREFIVRTVRDGGKRAQISRIGELVDIDRR